MSLLPNLDEMTDNEKLAVLESIQKSIAQSKEIQKRKIGENVDLVVQALKKIESDIRDRFDSVGNSIEKRVLSIKDGRDGINGKDGRDGKDGRNGKDGLKGDKGDAGQDGRNGLDGADGVSVVNANIDFDGSLIITLSTGQQINVGEVVSQDVVEKLKIITSGGAGSGGGGSGTVTSVAATVPSFLSVAGSPITGSGTLAITLSGTALPVANGGTGATTAGAALTSLGAIGSIASADASIVVTQVGSAVDLAVSQTSPASVLVEQVRNSTGATLTKGTAVYISGATGQIPTVSKALATGDATSAQTLGVITADISNNSNGYVTIIGLVANLDTSAYTDGAQLYLSPTTAGTLTATKPYAPQHLVYVAVVAHAHPTQGKLLVKVQNGYELDELHNVSAQSPATGQTIVYNSSTSLWEKNTVSLTAGVNGTLPIANGGTGTTSTTFVDAATNVTGTLPIANGGTNATTAGVALTNLSAAGTAIANTFTDSQVVQAATATAEVVRVRGIDTNTSALAVQRYSADANPAEINLYKSRGATVGSDARVQTNDVTGSINYYACGSSAGSYQIIAAIRAQDGTTSADNDLPGSLRFFTRGDGTSGTLTQRMILGSGGTLSVTSDISTSGGSITAAGQISGSYFFATPPSQVFLAITQNALYAAPTSGFSPGDVIYTQDAYYATTQGGSPGYIPTYQSVYLAADFTLQAASGVQACLTAANDTLTIAAATTYEFEGQYILNTGATTHTTAMAFLLASSATVSSFEYTTILWSAAANTISTSASFTQVSGVASKVLNATSTAVYTTIKFKGVMRTTLGGTITPQIAFSANPTGTNLMKKGSFIKFTPIGADTVEPIGLWS